AGDLHETGTAAAERDFHAACDVTVLEHEHIVAALAGDDRQLRNHGGLVRVQVELHGEQHAGTQDGVGVVDVGTHLYRAGDGVYARADDGDGADEVTVRVDHGAGTDQLADAYVGQVDLGHGEVELDDGDVVERGD